MEYINKHIGIFDFWSVFCAGIVIFTSYAVVFGKELTEVNLCDFPLFLYIVIAYVIGLILHSLSSVFIDYGVLKLNTGQVLACGYKERLFFKKYYKKYLQNNDLICDETKNIGFQRCYNLLKHYGLTYRIDKLHSLYGMARGISLGYFILSVIALINLFAHFIEIDSLSNIFILTVYIILMVTFYAMTKSIFIAGLNGYLSNINTQKMRRQINHENKKISKCDFDCRYVVNYFCFTCIGKYGCKRHLRR